MQFITTRASGRIPRTSTRKPTSRTRTRRQARWNLRASSTYCPSVWAAVCVSGRHSLDRSCSSSLRVSYSASTSCRRLSTGRHRSCRRSTSTEIWALLQRRPTTKCALSQWRKPQNYSVCCWRRHFLNHTITRTRYRH